MALELDGAAGRVFLLAAAGGAGDFHLVVDEHVVVLHGDDGVLRLLAFAVELRGGEINVVGLPHEGRETHVHARLGLRVDAAALVVQPLEAEAVQHLHLVAVLHIDAAVRPALAATERLEGQDELDVQRVVLKIRLLRLAAGGEELAAQLVEVPAREGIAVRAIEEHHRARRGFRAERGALAEHALHRELPPPALAGERVLRERRLPRLLLERDFLALALRLDFNLRRLVPARARQAAVVEDHAERVVAERDYLRAELVAGELALQVIVRPGGAGIALGEEGAGFRLRVGGEAERGSGEEGGEEEREFHGVGLLKSKARAKLPALLVEG